MLMMSEVGAKCAILFVGLLLVGCAGSSKSVEMAYDRASGQTTYETREMRLEDIHMTSGLQQRNRFYVQILGTCIGSDCVPSQYTMRFIKEGPQAVTVEGRDVTVTIGSETLRWEDAQTRETGQTATIRSGVFAKVSLSSKQLSTIGGGSSMRGTVCGERFTLPYQTRSPIRSLLTRLEQEGSGASDNVSGEG